MLLGLIGILLSLASVRNKSWKIAATGVLFCTLASQEKLLAEPLALISMILFVFVLILQKRKVLYSPFYVLISMGLSVVTTLILTILFGIARNFKFPFFNLVDIATSLVSWKIPRELVILPVEQLTFPPKTFPVGGIVGFLITVVTYNLVWAVIELFILLMIAGAMLYLLRKVISAVPAFITKCMVLIVALSVFMLGFWGTYSLSTYHNWIVEPPKNVFNPRFVPFYVGDQYWFKNTTTKSQQIIKNIAWYNATFTNTVPTIFWILLVINTIVFFIRRYEKDKGYRILDAAVMVNLLFPTFLAIQSSWLYNRYFDIFTYFFCLYVLFTSASLFLTTLHLNKRYVIAVCIILSVFIEIFPFQPTYGYFKPIWSNSGDYQNNYVELGRQILPFTGWELEHAEVRNRIYDTCKKSNNCGKIRVYSDYFGFWLGTPDNKPTWTLFAMNSSDNNIPTSQNIKGYKNTDFFVLSRIGLYFPIANPKERSIPKTVKPVFTISHRGFIVAWVYRGDDLQKARFSF